MGRGTIWVEKRCSRPGWKFTKLHTQIRQIFRNFQGGDSQNFLAKFVTLGLKILRLFRLKVLFIALKGNVNYSINHCNTYFLGITTLKKHFNVTKKKSY